MQYSDKNFNIHRRKVLKNTVRRHYSGLKKGTLLLLLLKLESHFVIYLPVTVTISVYSSYYRVSDAY
jgi:hypothetical protein